MIENKRIIGTMAFWCISVVISMIGGIFIHTQMPELEVVKVYLTAGLMLSFFKALVSFEGLPYFYEKKGIVGLSIGFFLFFLFLCAGIYMPVYLFWMIGSAYIAKSIHPYVGVLYHLMFTFLLCSIWGYGVNEFICYFLMGSVICILVCMADRQKTLSYVLVIVGSIELIVNFLFINFELGQAMNINSLMMLLSSLFVVLVSYPIQPVYEGTKSRMEVSLPLQEREAEEMEAAEEIEKAEATGAEQPADTKREEGEELAPYTTEEAVLICRLKAEKPAVYRHSLLISLLSAKAARTIHADECLAGAGGLYHEVGKLNGSDYIEEGVRLTRELGLPQCLTDIIRQHNVRGELPTTREAAIVSLTDSVVATVKYFEKQPREKRRSKDKIIDDIFQLRLTQGTFNRSGLSLEDYQILKDFYHTSLPKGGDNDDKL